MDKNPAMVRSCSGIHHTYDAASYVDALLPFPLYINILLFTNKIQIDETGDRGGIIWLSMHLFCCKAMLGTLGPGFLFTSQKQGYISLCIQPVNCCRLMFGTLVSVSRNLLIGMVRSC